VEFGLRSAGGGGAEVAAALTLAPLVRGRASAGFFAVPAPSPTVPSGGAIGSSGETASGITAAEV
jgi:hypothetical protein